MQLKLNNIVREIGIVSTLGLGYLILKNRKSVSVIEEYSEFDFISQSHLPEILEKIKLLESEDFPLLVEDIETFLELAHTITSCNASGKSLFELNRLYVKIVQNLKAMAHSARKSMKDSVIVTSVDCERDEIPMIENFCENVVRNVLLDIT